MLSKIESQAVHDRLAETIVYDERGQKIKMRSLWEGRPAILVFLRHFACIACRAHAREVWHQRSHYEQAGSRIVFIGNGAPEVISRFRTEMHLGDAPIYTDPDLQAFSAAGFKKSFLGRFGLTAVINSMNLASKGYWQAKHQRGDGNTLQLGGVLLVMPDGHVRYKYTSTAAGDFPPYSDVEYMTGIKVRPFALEAAESPLGKMPDFSQR